MSWKVERLLCVWVCRKQEQRSRKKGKCIVGAMSGAGGRGGSERTEMLWDNQEQEALGGIYNKHFGYGEIDPGKEQTKVGPTPRKMAKGGEDL